MRTIGEPYMCELPYVITKEDKVKMAYAFYSNKDLYEMELTIADEGAENICDLELLKAGDYEMYEDFYERVIDTKAVTGIAGLDAEDIKRISLLVFDYNDVVSAFISVFGIDDRKEIRDIVSRLGEAFVAL